MWINFKIIDGHFVDRNGTEIHTELLLANSHDIGEESGSVDAEKFSKVVFCKCGCQRIFLAALMPDAEEPNSQEWAEFAGYLVRGFRIAFVPNAFVKENWTQHKEPEQLSLF